MKKTDWTQALSLTANLKILPMIFTIWEKDVSYGRMLLTSTMQNIGFSNC